MKNKSVWTNKCEQVMGNQPRCKKGDHWMKRVMEFIRKRDWLWRTNRWLYIKLSELRGIVNYFRARKGVGGVFAWACCGSEFEVPKRHCLRRHSAFKNCTPSRTVLALHRQPLENAVCAINHGELEVPNINTVTNVQGPQDGSTSHVSHHTSPHTPRWVTIAWLSP